MLYVNDGLDELRDEAGPRCNIGSGRATDSRFRHLTSEAVAGQTWMRAAAGAVLGPWCALAPPSIHQLTRHHNVVTSVSGINLP